MDLLKNRDFTLSVDRSGSMHNSIGSGPTPTKSRWDSIKESTAQIATKLSEMDPDGITFYSFNDTVARQDNVTPEKVETLFKGLTPEGSTRLDLMLRHGFDNYFSRKAKGNAQPNGECFVIVTDGTPDDKGAAAKAIIDATKKVDNASELSVLFIQIGQDKEARDYLNSLDNDLKSQGAAHDIVSVINCDAVGNRDFTDVILSAISEAKISS